MKKILILNGSHSEITLIREAQAQGLHVTTTGNDPNLMGHEEANDYIEADYADKDAILEIAKSQQVDYICSCANDAGALTAAFISESLGLPGHDSYEVSKTIHLKDEFKKWAEKFGMPTPKLQNLSGLNYPLIVKPTDMTGGKGISVVRRPEELDSALSTARNTSRNGNIVLEQFIEGSLHSFSTFVVNRKVMASYSDVELSTVNPFSVSASYGPAYHIDEIRNRLIELTEDMASDLDLADGIVHFQYLWDGRKFFVLEVTRRCSGDLYPRPVSLSLGTSWEKAMVLSCQGRTADFISGAEQRGHFGRVCFMATRNGKIDSFCIHPEIQKHVVDIYYGFPKGFHVTNFMTQKLGVAVLQFDSFHQAQEKVRLVKDWAGVTLQEAP